MRRQSSARLVSILGALALCFGFPATVVGQTVVITWTTATNGAWTTAGNWSASPTSVVPNHVTQHDAVISAAGPAYTVTASGGATLSVRKLDVSSSSAKVVFNFSNTGPSLTLGAAASSLSAGVIEFQQGNGIFGQGTTSTTLGIASGAELLFSTATSTRNIGAMVLNNSGTVHGTSGVLALGNGGNLTLNNQSGGLIYADGAEIAFQSPTTLTNAGTLRANGAAGLLRFNGTYTTANLGTVDLINSGRAILAGTINNASATLAKPGSGSYELTNGTITGGTIAAGAITFTGSGGFLDAATFADNLTVPANTYVRFTNGASFSGANGTFGASGGLYWQQVGTLSGKSLTFGSGGYIYVAGANHTLTLGSTTTATGEIDLSTDSSSGTAITNQGTLNHTSGYGQIYAPTFSNSGSITHTSPNTYLVIGNTSSGYNTTNTGNITVNATGASIYLDGNVDNTGGTLTATNGQFFLRGTNTVAHLNGGTVDIASNGHVYLDGTITNSGTLNAPHTGSYELHGGTISGGTIAAGALTFTGSGGYLDGTTLADNLTLPANAYVRFTNGASFTGANATFGANAGMYWQQSGSLANKSLTFGTNGYIYLAGANDSLTLASSVTGTGEIEVSTDGAPGIVFTNQGTLNHTSGYGQIYAPTFNNSGSITHTSPNTYLVIGNTGSGYNTTNAGNITVNASGASIYLDGNVDNTGGTLTATNGQFILRGTNTVAHLNGGTVDIAANGHVYLNGTLTNTGTLNAPHTGSYELSSGTISGGTIAPGALTFTGSGGYLDATTLADNLTLPAGAYTRLINGASFTGANATFGANAGLYWEQAATLTGKSLSFASGGYIYVAGNNHTLTLDNATTGTGEIELTTDGSSGTAITNQGTLNHTSGYGQIYAPTLSNSGSITHTSPNTYLIIGNTNTGYNTTNTGHITVNATGASVYLDGNFDNSGGTLTATNGQFIFRGNNTVAHVNAGTVDVAAGAHAYLNGTLTNSGTLNAPHSGTYELYSGTITGGSIAAGALSFTGSGGYLDGATLADNLTLPANSYVRLSNGSTFTGANATFGANAGLYWEQAGTLSGKSLGFASGGYIYVSGANHTLTLDSATTATGEIDLTTDSSSGTSITNQGTLNHTSGYGQIYAPTFTNSGSITHTSPGTYLIIGSTSSGYNTNNSGTITVNGANSSIYLDGNVANTGTLNATNGQFIFRGNTTNANLNGGTVNVAAGNGHAYLNGTVTNSGTLAAPATGSYELYGGTIAGGTVANNALNFTSSGGKLDGVTLTGSLNLPIGSNVQLLNGTTFTGPAASLGGNSLIYWQQAGTLTGKSLTFAAGGEIYLYNPTNTTPATLTFDSATTATGQVRIDPDGSNGSAFTNQGTLTHTSSGFGQIYARTVTNSGTITNTATNGQFFLGNTSSGYDTTNSGTITVNGSNATIFVDGNFTNAGGTINATNGTLQFRGSNTTAHLNSGTTHISAGAHAYLAGTLDNSATLFAAPATGIFELLGGSITGGSIASGALTFTTSGGILNAVTLLDPAINLPSSASVTLTNGSDFSAAANLGASASINWNQSGTMSGRTLTFGSGARVYLNSAGASLTLASNTTATGTLGLYSDSFSTGTSILNQGSLTNTAGTGSLYARSFTNTGSITATGGTVNLGTTLAGYSFGNNLGGAINLNGGNAQFFAPASTVITNNGTINVQSGTLFTNSVLTNGTTGVITGAGTISGSLKMDGGTIAPGNAGIGTLNFVSGALTVTNPSTYQVDLGGATSDQLVFQSPPSVINIGTSLLSLSLNLTAAPTSATAYNLIHISSGGTGITGTFVGLPNSGDVLTASFNSTPYFFAISYQPNTIALTVVPVPEPATYALFGLGLGLLAFVRRRRR
jgi:hypothetical protein